MLASYRIGATGCVLSRLLVSTRRRLRLAARSPSRRGDKTCNRVSFPTSIPTYSVSQAKVSPGGLFYGFFVSFRSEDFETDIWSMLLSLLISFRTKKTDYVCVLSKTR